MRWLIALRYVARVRNVSDPQLHDVGAPLLFERTEGRDFVLRDGTGVAQIVLDRGESVADLHAVVIQRYGAGHETEVEAIEPGARVRVRGRVRELLETDEGWRYVVTAEQLELA